MGPAASARLGTSAQASRPASQPAANRAHHSPASPASLLPNPKPRRPSSAPRLSPCTPQAKGLDPLGDSYLGVEDSGGAPRRGATRFDSFDSLEPSTMDIKPRESPHSVHSAALHPAALVGGARTGGKGGPSVLAALVHSGQSIGQKDMGGMRWIFRPWLSSKLPGSLTIRRGLRPLGVPRPCPLLQRRASCRSRRRRTRRCPWWRRRHRRRQRSRRSWGGWGMGTRRGGGVRRRRRYMQRRRR